MRFRRVGRSFARPWERVLDIDPPASYDRIVFKEKCDNVFDAMLTYANGGQKWAA